MKGTGRAIAVIGLAPSVLARLGGPLGVAVRAAAADLARETAGTSEHEARVLRATWAATARVPVPAGLRGVHPSWIESALATLPARARGDLASGGMDPAGVWLARRACAELCALPPANGVAPPTSSSDAVRLPDDQLARWLAHVGADQVAFALGAAGPEALVAAARVAGERVRAAAGRIGVAPRAGHLGPQRAAIARCRMPLDGRALVLIGARALAPHLSPTERQQIPLRLDRTLGVAVRTELEAHAALPVAQAPDWLALGAALR